MRSYSFTDIRDRQCEVLEHAAIEPVLLTEPTTSGYVIMSADDYQSLLNRLIAVEDNAMGKLAEVALQKSQMVGSELFITELTRLANLGT